VDDAHGAAADLAHDSILAIEDLARQEVGHARRTRLPSRTQARWVGSATLLARHKSRITAAGVAARMAVRLRRRKEAPTLPNFTFAQYGSSKRVAS
jgi:hypothetical protein